MAGLHKLRAYLPPRDPYLWIALCVLLSIGVITSILDLAKLPDEETLRANAEQQRVVIDGATGKVSGLSNEEAENAAPFDVGDKTAEEKSPEEPAAQAPVKVEASESDGLPDGLPELRTKPAVVEIAPVERSRESLVNAPAPEITETVDGMKIPKRGEKDASAAQIYARSFTRKPEQQLIVVVITDVGLSRQSVGLTMGLPKEVTVAVSPYTSAAAASISALRNSGIEVWGMLPVMGERYPQDDPGPLGLIASMPQSEVLRRLHQIMETLPGAVGFVLPANENISPHGAMFAEVVKDIDTRGLRLLSTHPTRTIDQISADKTIQPSIRRADMILDATMNSAQIESKLAGLAEAAKGHDEFIVMASAQPQTIEILRAWFAKNPLAAPLTLAPLSALYQPKEVAPVVVEEKGGHGAPKEEKPKVEKPKPKKPLPQDQYLNPPAEKKQAGGH